MLIIKPYIGALPRACIVMVHASLTIKLGQRVVTHLFVLPDQAVLGVQIYSKMNSDIQIFNNPSFGEIRTAGTSNEPLFCLADLCHAIGIKDVSRCASRLDDDVRLTHPIFDSLGRVQNAIFVTEAGMYDVIIRSDSDRAKPFRKWVTSVVLPSIRKAGEYSVKSKPKREPSLTTKVRVGIEWVKSVSSMLNLNDASKLLLLGKIAEPLNLPLPDYVTAKGVPFSPTELLKRFGVNISVREFNKKMKETGMLENRSRTSSHGGVKNFPVLVGKGLEYGENAMNPNCQNQTQPRYYESSFGILLSELKFSTSQSVKA